MKLLSVGPCPVCGIDIWKRKRPPVVQITKYGIMFNFKAVPYELNEHGRHFWILLTNGSRMQVAICKDCFAKLNDTTVKEIMANIVFTRLQDVDKMSWQLFDFVRTHEIFKWFGTEQEVVDYLKQVQNAKTDSSR